MFNFWVLFNAGTTLLSHHSFLSWMDHSLNYLEITLIHKVQCLSFYFIIIIILHFSYDRFSNYFVRTMLPQLQLIMVGFEFKDAVKQGPMSTLGDKNGNKDERFK